MFSNQHAQENLIGTLVKHNGIFIGLNDTLLTAVETMAKENIDVLPVVSKENTKIIGILSYRDIIATYKYGIDEHKKKQPHISLRRNGLKILVRGQRIVSAIKRRGK